MLEAKLTLPGTGNDITGVSVFTWLRPDGRRGESGCGAQGEVKRLESDPADPGQSGERAAGRESLPTWSGGGECAPLLASLALSLRGKTKSPPLPTTPPPPPLPPPPPPLPLPTSPSPPCRRPVTYTSMGPAELLTRSPPGRSEKGSRRIGWIGSGMVEGRCWVVNGVAMGCDRTAVRRSSGGSECEVVVWRLRHSSGVAEPS